MWFVTQDSLATAQSSAIAGSRVSVQKHCKKRYSKGKKIQNVGRGPLVNYSPQKEMLIR